MRTLVQCSWCHEMATVGAPPWPACAHCGHRADQPRMDCDCRACLMTGLVRLARAGEDTDWAYLAAVRAMAEADELGIDDEEVPF